VAFADAEHRGDGGKRGFADGEAALQRVDDAPIEFGKRFHD